ncbi:class I SAM-dependent methyltransferase [Psychrobacter sp. M13]|uniref:class I SAM-dependent methyltransferase n=1 Tax=Psychrobacter sp. M13 TaxID=3067275 RepID=UPI00273A9827|nr:class I SAM-dependent methyltransferase [Psychrobacter sp. M13]WLP93991.1 class I SAM-dependent methyltransferase [Psychrobacter sp. M13]
MSTLQSVLSTSQHYRLIYVDEAQQGQVAQLQDLVIQHNLSLILAPELITDRLNQKRLQQLSADSAQAIVLLDNKNQLSLLVDGLSVAPEWDKLQRRVVSAGRKSELLLQAAKITTDSQVIDATAGFGHDSLILASTGAQVTMLEQQPIMALLLLAEQQRMSREPNWQKLMARLHIISTDALSYFAYLQDVTVDARDTAINKSADVIYLDPMFPMDSYQNSKTGKGAKVNKQMQALHQLAAPPTVEQEQQLLQSAQAVIKNGEQQSGRVIIKRPQQAPLFANQAADESWQNAALRFDGYFIL